MLPPGFGRDGGIAPSTPQPVVVARISRFRTRERVDGGALARFLIEHLATPDPRLPEIAFLTATPRWPFARQTPGASLRWEGCAFTINPPCGRFDGCLVYDGLLAETVIDCPPDRTLLLTGEPPTIKAYHERFAAQFWQVVTCHSDLAHPRLVLGQQAYPWIVGFDKNAADLAHGAKTLDAFLAEAAPSDKPRLLSVMVSDKAITPAHRHRRRLVGELKEHFGERLTIFGRGVNDIADKAAALAPFKYHLALENSAHFHYWTEKLADSYLCWSYPLYWGCPNLADYFAAQSFGRVNIYDTRATIAVIEEAIVEERWAKALPALAEARRRVLLEYNLFALAARLLGSPSRLPAERLRLRPEQTFREHWTRKLRHRAKRALPRRWRKEKTKPLGAPLE
jgi:Glycosyltransferase family 10 (fucosyltransferase) C-term